MLVLRMPFLKTVGLILAATFWGGSVSTAHAASGDWYLALGDSLAAGFQSQPSSPANRRRRSMRWGGLNRVLGLQ